MTLTVPTPAWNVQPEDLEMVPEYFPLERTHRIIENADSSVVSNRIAVALKESSIQAEYESTKAKCKTEDCVDFRIRLYAGGEEGEPVVVEIQRRSGSARSFMQACRTIFDAAENKTSKPSQSVVPPLGSVSSMSFLPKAPLGRIQSDFHEALSTTTTLLRSEQMESKVLGLENLLSLTDLTKTGFNTASAASTALCEGDQKYPVREMVTQILKEMDESLAVSRNAVNLSLNAFANALEFYHSQGRLNNTTVLSWFETNVFEDFMGALSDVSHNSFRAYFAARCLKALISCSPSAKTSFSAKGGEELLKTARDYASIHHKLLETECEACLQCL